MSAAQDERITRIKISAADQKFDIVQLHDGVAPLAVMRDGVIEIFSSLQFQGGQLVIAAASATQVGLIAVIVVILERLVGLGRVVRSKQALRRFPLR